MTHPTRAHSHPPSFLYIDQCIPDEPVRPALDTNVFDDIIDEEGDRRTNFDDNEDDNMPHQEMNNFVAALTTESIGDTPSGSRDESSGRTNRDPSHDASQGKSGSQSDLYCDNELDNDTAREARIA